MPDRSDIRDYVREQTLVETDDFADTKIDAIINQGLRVLSTRFDWPWLAETGTLSVVASTTAYTMPTDLSRSLAITHPTKANRLVEVSPWEILGKYGGDLPSGTPTSYFVHGRTMNLDRIPYEDVDYTWLYFKNATVLSNDTDEPEFAAEFHLILADYAVAKVWEREEDFTKADEAMKDYQEGVENMARFYLDVSHDRPIVFGESRDIGMRRHATNMPFLDGA